METLTYKFGETPEEVIRGRLAEWQGTVYAPLDSHRVLHPVLYRNTDDDALILMLRGLAFIADHGGTYEQHLRTPAWQLRVDILDELDIDETD